MQHARHLATATHGCEVLASVVVFRDEGQWRSRPGVVEQDFCRLVVCGWSHRSDRFAPSGKGHINRSTKNSGRPMSRRMPQPQGDEASTGCARRTVVVGRQLRQKRRARPWLDVSRSPIATAIPHRHDATRPDRCHTVERWCSGPPEIPRPPGPSEDRVTCHLPGLCPCVLRRHRGRHWIPGSKLSHRATWRMDAPARPGQSRAFRGRARCGQGRD